MIQFYECFFVMSYLTNRYIFFPSNGFFSPEIIFALLKTHILLTVLMIMYNLDILFP